jgi:sporulation protein YlmC with PRC-barrel domain
MKQFSTTLYACVLYAVTAFCAEDTKETRTTDSKASSLTTHKANEMISASVQSKGGEKLGTVRDLAFEMPSGRLAYIIVASGGILGLGADYHAVPPRAFSHDTQSPKVLTLDITKEKWEAAPKFKKDQLPSLNAHREQIDEHFKAADAKAEVKIGGARAEVKVTTPASKDQPLSLAMDVIGRTVTTKQSEDVGKVSDLLLDMNSATVPFAIVSTGTLLKPSDARYAISIDKLSLGGDKKIVFDSDRASLDNAERFDPRKGQTRSRLSAGVYKYEEPDAAVVVKSDTEKTVASATLKSDDSSPTALSLVKEGNRYVGEQAKDKLVQIRSEKSTSGLQPSVWYVVFYNSTAALKATEVKFVSGKMTDVKRPLRLLEATSDKSEPLDREKIKIDSDEALKAALKDPVLESNKPVASEMRLERGEGAVPTWRIQFWTAKADGGDVSLGAISLSAEDGKVVKNDLKAEKVD